ncbi:MAG: hypothetical protein K9J17_16095 [Flavobacteriales bacterium]|nr:hypothetical protein [Flavobacteriales bacterium]
MDLIGKITWISMFLTPLVTVPVVWKLTDWAKWKRVIVALLLAVVTSIILYQVSMEIIFRDGMGPG